jgi:hypothetical protein
VRNEFRAPEGKRDVRNEFRAPEGKGMRNEFRAPEGKGMRNEFRAPEAEIFWGRQIRHFAAQSRCEARVYLKRKSSLNP